MIGTTDPALSDLPLFDETLVVSGDDGLELIGWRCSRCERLTFGHARMCPMCGSSEGRDTRLSALGRLETWTSVSVPSGSYDIGYVMLGDGEDDQEVRVLGPLVTDDVAELRSGQTVRVGFDHSEILGVDSVHHVFLTTTEEPA